MTRPTQLVGMIGIGQLGLPVAINLMRAGLRVIGHRRVDREAFVRAGGEALDTPAEVAGKADVLRLCLPGEQDIAAAIQLLEAESTPAMPSPLAEQGNDLPIPAAFSLIH